MYNKKISVYIPTHNRPDFLKRALKSLSHQKWSDFQVIVSDDGSSIENYRATKQIVKDLKASFSDIILLRSEYPQGACVARNNAIDAADGYYITGLDDDDEFTSERLDIFIKSQYLSSYPYLSTGQIVDDGMFRTKSTMDLDKETTLSSLLFRNVVGNQVITEKQLIKNIGGFDKNFPAWQDYELWLRLTKEYGSGYKLPYHTYILNIGHELNRVTSSEKGIDAVNRFVQKHEALLKKKHIQTLYLQDLVNRKQPLSMTQLLKYTNKNNFFMALRYIFFRKYPNIKNILKKYNDHYPF